VTVERPAVNAARPAAPVAGLRGARTGVVGPGPAGAAAALVDPRSGLDADLPGPARPPAAHQASPPMACCQAPTTSGSRRARPSRSRMARAHRTPRRWGPPDKVWGRQATRRRDGWPAPEPSRHSAVAHDRAAATARKASAAGAAARLLAVPSGIDGAHRRRVNAQPVSRRIPEVVARSRRPDPADTCRSSGAATLPVQVPLRYWLVGGSAVAVSVWVSGVGPGLPSPLSSWGAWSPRPSPDLEERRWAARLWWCHPGGPRRASG